MCANLAFRASAVLVAPLFAVRAALAIVGPSEPDPADADRVVTVLTRGPEGSSYCSGVVIGPDAVLTAAHCVRTAKDTAILLRDGSGAPRLAEVAEVTRHPEYRADAVAARRVSVDAAVLRLKEPLGPPFRAVALAETAPQVGDAVILAGFGQTRAGDPKSGGALRRIALTVRAPLSRVLLWLDGGGAAGACSGDSGAPVFSADGRALLAIVAWTDGGDRRGCGGVTQGPLVGPLKAWIEGFAAR